MCSWVDGDADWNDGLNPCPWTARSTPRSVFNNGFDLAEGATQVDVLYYAQTDKRELLGCVKVRTRTNLMRHRPPALPLLGPELLTAPRCTSHLRGTAGPAAP